jgi:hypothetical protein
MLETVLLLKLIGITCIEMITGSKDKSAVEGLPPKVIDMVGKMVEDEKDERWSATDILDYGDYEFERPKITEVNRDEGEEQADNKDNKDNAEEEPERKVNKRKVEGEDSDIDEHRPG